MWSSAADGVVFRTTTVADVGYEVVCCDEAEGKKCKDYVHDLLLVCFVLFGARPYTVISRVWVLDRIDRPKFRWIKMKSLSTKSAAGLEERAGDPAGVVRGDEGDDIADVVGLAGTTEWGL